MAQSTPVTPSPPTHSSSGTRSKIYSSQEGSSPFFGFSDSIINRAQKIRSPPRRPPLTPIPTFDFNTTPIYVSHPGSQLYFINPSPSRIPRPKTPVLDTTDIDAFMRNLPVPDPPIFITCLSTNTPSTVPITTTSSSPRRDRYTIATPSCSDFLL